MLRPSIAARKSSDDRRLFINRLIDPSGSLILALCADEALLYLLQGYNDRRRHLWLTIRLST
jgi:hypothetical protein